MPLEALAMLLTPMYVALWILAAALVILAVVMLAMGELGGLVVLAAGSLCALAATWARRKEATP